MLSRNFNKKVVKIRENTVSQNLAEQILPRTIVPHFKQKPNTLTYEKLKNHFHIIRHGRHVPA